MPGGANNNNYGNVQLIVQVADRANVDAVWPGWWVLKISQLILQGSSHSGLFASCQASLQGCFSMHCRV